MSRSQEIAKEHAAIHAVMREIRVELDRLIAHPARPGDEWDLPELLRSFQGHLTRHFMLEESGGLLGDAALYYDPGTERAVHELIEEHREFERMVERVLTGLDSGLVPPVIVQQCFDRDMRKLLAGLARHEAVETSLLERLVEQETGARD
jgi:hypothetical protein